MRALIACEESQTVVKEFRKLGVDAFSCDLLPPSGGHPEWHFQCDIFEVLEHHDKPWDLMIAHPPCTFLSGSSVQWLSHPEDKDLLFDQRRPHPKYPNRRKDMLDSIEFVKALYNAPIPHIVIENPVGLLSTRWRKPDQIIQPYMFGDEVTKTTCLWLKNLPKLKPTNMVGKGEQITFSSGKKMSKWFNDAMVNSKTDDERRRVRSMTFPGIAKALANQYYEFLTMNVKQHIMRSS